MNTTQLPKDAHLRPEGIRSYNNPRNRNSYGGDRARVARNAGKEPAASLASALRVKNFRIVLDAIGDADLAVALDLTLNRVKELASGANFSDEMAFHIETVLGLSHGFMDKVNPVLTAERIQAIRVIPETREFVHEAETIAAAPRAAEPVASVESIAPAAIVELVTPVAAATPAAGPVESIAPAAAVEPLPPVAAVVTVAPESAAAVTPTGSRPVLSIKKTNTITPDQEHLMTNTETLPAGTPYAEAAPVLVTYVSKRTPVLNAEEATVPVVNSDVALNAPARAPTEISVKSEPVADAATTGMVRRQNLNVLTETAGAKTILARIMGLSAANMSHRLHGKTFIDGEMGRLFCSTLGLPENWFETPKTSADVPADVRAKLGAKDFTGNPPAKRASAAKKQTPVSVDSPAEVKAVAVSAPVSVGLPVAATAAYVEPVVNPVETVVASAVVAASEPAVEAPLTLVAPVAPAAPAPLAQVKAVSAPLAVPAVREVASNDIVKTAPIAEALIRILAMKARDGSLTEVEALNLLNRVASL